MIKYGEVFTIQDAENAITKLSSDKALGPDGFGIALLKNKDNLALRERACKVLVEMANSYILPEHIRVSIACFLLKNKNDSAKFEDIRLI